MEIYDPTYFVGFDLSADPLKLVGAPADCKANVQRPGKTLAGPAQREDVRKRRQRQLWRAVLQQDDGGVPVTTRTPLRGRHLALLALALVALAAADGALHLLAAQATPFGGRPTTPPPQEAGGIIGWILAKQAEFYRAMSSTIRAAKTDGSAFWTLLGISFAYGVFHAAGPGHGKAVISSYLVANEETARRGIVLSFVSAMLQALVAVLIVGIGAWLLGATARTLCSTERAIEIVSYGLIAVLGAWLVFTKGRGFLKIIAAVVVRRCAGAGACGRACARSSSRARPCASSRQP